VRPTLDAERLEKPSQMTSATAVTIEVDQLAHREAAFHLLQLKLDRGGAFD
jgi:hypothetical protein